MDLFAQPRTGPVPLLSADPVGSPAGQRSDWKGWASIVMALVCMPAGLVLGILALRQARRDGDRPLRTLAILGTALNAVALAVVGLLLATGVIGGGAGRCRSCASTRFAATACRPRRPGAPSSRRRSARSWSPGSPHWTATWPSAPSGAAPGGTRSGTPATRCWRADPTRPPARESASP
jgi:hypothetical protein